MSWRGWRRSVVVMVVLMSAGAVWAWEETFEKPTREEALKFLKSLPRVARGRPGEYWV